MRSHLQTYTIATAQTRTILTTDILIEAPNWHPDGWFLVNGGGHLYRADTTLTEIPTPLGQRCNNDHLLTPHGILYSAHRGQGAEIFRLGHDAPLSPQPPSWLHAISPDGQTLAYAAARQGRTVDIYTKPLSGPETRLTMGEGHSDGPDFSPDGRTIFYNSDRSGHAQIWAMNADGTDQRRLFADEHVNWFPHPSPDGNHLLYLAYNPGTQGHPRNLPVALTLCTPDGQNRRRILEFTGGQGTINVPCWAPDSTAFAFIRYE